MKIQEEWRPVPGYEGLYEVSTLGSVRRAKDSRLRSAGHVLALSISTQGYPQITLSREGKRRTEKVHHVVAAAFIGPRPEGMYVLHSDGTKTNNNTENLRYGSPSENMYDAHRHGTNCGFKKGTEHDRAKLTEGQVREIRAIKGRTISSLSREYGVARKTVRQIINKEIWRHVS